jgi:hypothetical protein
LPVNDRKLVGPIQGMDDEDVAENRPASISMKHGCVFADRVFAKTLQTRPPRRRAISP